MEMKMKLITIEYVVIRTVNGVDRAFFLYAIRAEDGIWRLESM